MNEQSEGKRFFSKIAGAAYVFGDGNKVVFAHGFLDVTPQTFPGTFQNPNPSVVDRRNGKSKFEVYLAELTELVSEGNPLIYTQETVKTSEPIPRLDADKNARSEMEISTQDRALMNASGGNVKVTGDVNVGTGVAGAPTDVNSSTVDQRLQNEVLATRPAIGPGAMSKADEIRAAAAANLNKSQ